MKKIIVALTFTVFLLSAMAVPSFSQKLDVGVEVGDWFRYIAEVTLWESVDPFLPAGFYGPISLADNQTYNILYNVTDITSAAGGDNVTFEITYNWKNGSVTYGTAEQNVSTSVEALYQFLIGADMEPDDMFDDTFSFMGFSTIPPRYINETIQTTYAGETRDTNVNDYSIEMFGSTYSYIQQWDKTTGMRVYFENHGEAGGFGGSNPYNYTVVWTLFESSEWTVVPEFPTGTALLLVFAALTISVEIIRRKKLKK
jgi:hypothetical protein